MRGLVELCACLFLVGQIYCTLMHNQAVRERDLKSKRFMYLGMLVCFVFSFVLVMINLVQFERSLPAILLVPVALLAMVLTGFELGRPVDMSIFEEPEENNQEFLEELDQNMEGDSQEDGDQKYY